METTDYIINKNGICDLFIHKEKTEEDLMTQELIEEPIVGKPQVAIYIDDCQNLDGRK